MKIPNENRNDDSFLRWKELGGTNQFAAYMSYFESVLAALIPYLPSDTVSSAIDFIEEEERTLGKPEKDSEWNNKANVRNGYHTDVPGMIGELICAAKLFTKFKWISLPQDKYTQHTQKIDIIATTNALLDDIAVQVKVVRLEGRNLLIEPSWLKGESTHVALVDITDQELWVIDRFKLWEHHSEQILTEDELTNISTFHWYNGLSEKTPSLYPRG